MKILIIEDEGISFSRLKRLLLEIDTNYNIKGPVTSVESILSELKEHDDYDIIFSDIRLEDGLSFDAFQNVHVDAPIIFTTAYNEYALEAFRHNGIDYLLKPISFEELQKAIYKANRMHPNHLAISHLIDEIYSKKKDKYRERFLIPKGDEYIIVDTEDINHITTSDNNVRAYLNDGTSVVISQTMNELEQELDPKQFFRASRQYIVHLNSIMKISNFFNSKLMIRLKGYPKVEVQISKDKSSQLKDWLDR